MIYPYKKILKELQKISDSTDTVLTFMSDAPYICDLCDTSKCFDYSKSKYSGEVRALIKELANTGHIDLPDPRYMQFSLTAKGLHPWLIQWDAIKKFLIESVAVPVAVSIATTLITLWLKSLL